MYDVIGLGTLATDVLMRVDRLPEADGFCVVKESVHQPGGSGTNVIVQLARLGARCGYIGAVGDDALGREATGSLEAEGVDAGHMVVRPGGETLHTDIVVADDGDKFIMLNMGDTFLSLRPDEVPDAALEGARALYTDLLPKDAARDALVRAHRAGVETVVNIQVDVPTMLGFGWTEEELWDVFPYIDVLAPCRAALYRLCGTKDLDACAERIRERCAGTLVFTLGAKGSVAYAPDGERVEVGAAPADVVDTTGAGDSYIGAFTYAHCLRGADLQGAMEFASACAARTTEGLGARVSPTLDEVSRAGGRNWAEVLGA